jgi:hypothetical protein
MKTRSVLAAASALAALGLAGCSADSQVASLGDVSAAAKAASFADDQRSQPERAEALAVCLRDGGVPAATDEFNDEQGQKMVRITAEEPYAYYFGSTVDMFPGPGVEAAEAVSAAYDSLARLAAKYDPSLLEGLGGASAPPAGPESAAQASPYLIVGQNDHTDLLNRCLESSAFTEPVFGVDPDQEIKQKQLDAEATLRWAECARAHGYPNLADPPPVKADNWRTEPAVALPADITEAALRELLASCPAFDLAARQALDDAVAALDPDRGQEDVLAIYDAHPMGDPVIGFDAPGFDRRDAERRGDLEQSEWDRLERLMLVLHEEIVAYNQGREERFGTMGGLG